MAVTETRVLPAAFIEAGGKTFLDQLSKASGQYGAADLSKSFGQDFVAQMDPLQLEAMKQATAGIGSYEPFLQAAQAATGPQAYKDYMSPYQQEVIDTTLQEYDLQAQKGLGSIAQQAIGAGAFGGAREGVAQAEYMTGSDRNRAALQAQLLGQNFGQAQAAAGRAFGEQTNLASLQPALEGQMFAAMGAVGGEDLAYRTAVSDANKQRERLAAYEPYERAAFLGSGLGSLASSGMSSPSSPLGTGMSSPQMTPLETALKAGTTLGGIYGTI